ncbi:MAG: hypothetical protein J6M12_06970 [Clostridia bacterium]|nr:hypothetical protein [Clostridia bacterium]
MNIIKRCGRFVLLEQYGNKYIQYDVGVGKEELLRIKLTEEEFEEIQKEQTVPASIVNDLGGRCSSEELRTALIKDYLRTVSDYSEKRLDLIIQKLNSHKDVFFEFYEYVLYEEFSDNPIVVEGKTARYLASNYPLSPLGAYNYLIYLRDMPEKALADLNAGLPRRKVFDEKRVMEIQELIRGEKSKS